MSNGPTASRSGPPQRPPQRHRNNNGGIGVRRRWVKVLAITVVVLAVLFTAADRLAVHYADKEAAQLAKEKYGYGNTTDGYLDVSIEGFPFLTQAAGQDFGHVTLTAGRFSIDTTSNTQGGYLHIDRLHLNLRDVKVTSLTARSAEANLATGTLSLSYKELSGVVTRLAGNGGPLQVSQAAGSSGQAARVKVSGTVGGTALNTTGTLLAQGTELSLTVPGAERASTVWRVDLPAGVGFTAARATADGIEISLVGHQVTLGSSRYGG
ncbi:hypothetical protein GCM10010397_43820 [Streptomyces spinoverrucosus]|nr:hypothetical protein GCM10010397_43820 [Streptomyces spinoverrucosus]